MNDENKQRKIIIMSLAGLLFGSLFFTFGISINTSIIPMIVNYILSILMFIASYLAVHNNNKYKQKIFLFIQCLTIFMIIFVTYAFFNQIL